MAKKRKHRRGKSRRKRNWGSYSFANPRRKRRRRRNWGSYSFKNPKHRRRGRHRRRNPGGIIGATMGYLKSEVPGGALAGAFDALAGDALVSFVPGGALATGAAKIVGGSLIAAVGDRFAPGFLKRMMPGFAAGMAALGTKRIVGSFASTPMGMLEDLADEYGEALAELVSGGGDLRELVSGEIGLTDLVTSASPEEVAQDEQFRGG